MLGVSGVCIEVAHIAGTAVPTTDGEKRYGRIYLSNQGRRVVSILRRA